MNYLQQHQNVVEIAGAIIICIEQILPHLPIKADSTVQLIINIAKTIFAKKE